MARKHKPEDIISKLREAERRASFRSIMHSATCWAVTGVPRVIDQRRAIASIWVLGSP